MSFSEREQYLAQAGADILLGLEQDGLAPFPNRHAVGKAIHDSFVRDRWDRQLAMHDIYGMLRRSCPHYWSGRRLENICEDLRKRKDIHIFRYLQGFGWGFLNKTEALEWQDDKDRATTTAVKTRNKIVGDINDKWPDGEPPIPALELQQKQIEAPKP